MKHPWKLLILLLLSFGLIWAQTGESVRYKTMGFDMELLSYGGSLGGFYSYHTSEALSLDLELDWSLVESNDTFNYIDYTGRVISLNNRNLSFVKLMPGLTWFPFIDSMHPSFQIGSFISAGPVWSLNTDDNKGFIDRWGKVESDFAPIFRGGVHIRILSGQGGSYTFRVGYDYASFGEIIDERQTYQGLFLQAGMEFLNR
ncbi:MAG: hypothetical protein H8E26_12965 [FCB group bacterium]|nr:hypothetical protein [FCB group bacterium]MBL7028528.1 hypothetical protein [Candidatus Neomarinimicrobiota bacterium]MBL7121592.1 hypothetical protein [Candidatus Neomarinimicrobiota bacterium]